MYFYNAMPGVVNCNLLVEQDRTGHVYLHPVVPDLKMAIHLHFFDDTAHSRADLTARKFWEREYGREGFTYLGITKPTMLDVFDYEPVLFKDRLVLRFDETVSSVVKDPKLLLLADEMGDSCKYLLDPKYRVETQSHLDLLVANFDHWVHLGRTKSLQPWCITVGGGVGNNDIFETLAAVEVNFNHSAISRAFPKGSRGKEYLMRLLVLALRKNLVEIPWLYKGVYDWVRLDPQNSEYYSSYDHHEGRLVEHGCGHYCLIERVNTLVGRYIAPVGKVLTGGKTPEQHYFIGSDSWKQSMEFLKAEMKWVSQHSFNKLMDMYRTGKVTNPIPKPRVFAGSPLSQDGSLDIYDACKRASEELSVGDRNAIRK